MSICGGVWEGWGLKGEEGKLDLEGLALEGGDIAVLACKGLGAGFRWDL